MSDQATGDYANKPIINKPAFGIVACDNSNPSPLAALAHLVNIEIQDGFEPIGAPFFEPNRALWCQALYKRPLVRVDIPKPDLIPGNRKR